MASTKKTKSTTKKTPQPKKEKAPKAVTPSKAVKPNRVGALDAAAQVLADSDAPMNIADLLAKIEAKGLWKSPGGKTPGATLSAAIGREIKDKGSAARFKKVERGMFSATKATSTR